MNKMGPQFGAVDAVKLGDFQAKLLAAPLTNSVMPHK